MKPGTFDLTVGLSEGVYHFEGSAESFHVNGRIATIEMGAPVKMEAQSHRPVLFLDFDGVLNNQPWWDTRRGDEAIDVTDHFDPENVARLNRVIKATGAMVVVSSNWRCGRTIEELQALLDSIGFEGKVIDVTPDLPGFASRGEEIRGWLTANRWAERWAAVDDDNCDLERFVQTEFDFGLTEADADALIQVLS